MTGCMPRRPRRQLIFLEQNSIRPTLTRQVIKDAHAQYTAADNNYARAGPHLNLPARLYDFDVAK